MHARSVAALALAAVLGVASPARGQTATVSTTVEAMAVQVRERLAERWGVDAAAVVVELTPAPGRWPPEGARDVTLLGSGAEGWWVVRTDVPGDAGVRLRAGIEVAVPVAARALPRGHPLAPSDMEVGGEVRWGPPPAAAETVAEPGWQTARALARGEVLRAPAVRPPPAVRPGDPVEVVWRRGSVSATTSGTAAGAASLGGEVAVRLGGGRRLSGLVVAAGVVDVSRKGGM
jgi:flagella basal body P-ring formation protein FlgA